VHFLRLTASLTKGFTRPITATSQSQHRAKLINMKAGLLILAGPDVLHRHGPDILHVYICYMICTNIYIYIYMTELFAGIANNTTKHIASE